MSYEDDNSGSAEDRVEYRWNIPIPVQVEGALQDGTEVSERTITTDASPSGMCLLLPLSIRKGERLKINAPEEQFESQAIVTNSSPLGPNMNRVRVMFSKDTKFSREAAPKKYVYDYHWGNWVGYILDGMYFDTKYEPFGRVEGSKVLAIDSDDVIFNIRNGKVYDLRTNVIGSII